MSLYLRDDLLILETVLTENELSICHKVFKKMNFLEFLEVEDLDFILSGIQSKLKNLLTVVKPWSCLKEQLNSFSTTIGIELDDFTPNCYVWHGFCTFNCYLCYALKNHCIKNDYKLGKGWKHRHRYQRLHSKMMTTITNFLQNNIVYMVFKYHQDKPTASVASFCGHPDPFVEKEPEAATGNPVNCGDTSRKRKAEPFKVRFNLNIELINGDGSTPVATFRLPEQDHVIEEDEPSYHPISPAYRLQPSLGTGQDDYHPEYLIGDAAVDESEDFELH
jgi:hypothetical protein